MPGCRPAAIGDLGQQSSDSGPPSSHREMTFPATSCRTRPAAVWSVRLAVAAYPWPPNGGQRQGNLFGRIKGDCRSCLLIRPHTPTVFKCETEAGQSSVARVAHRGFERERSGQPQARRHGRRSTGERAWQSGLTGVSIRKECWDDAATRGGLRCVRATGQREPTALAPRCVSRGRRGLGGQRWWLPNPSRCGRCP